MALDEAAFDAVQAEFTEQQLSVLPRGWFGTNALLPQDEQFDDGNNAVALKAGASYVTIRGFAKSGAVIFDQQETIKSQFGLTGAVGDQIDVIAADFFDNTLPRFSGESDASYKSRIVSRLFVPTSTRQGMADAIFRAVGAYPVILERREAGLTGGYLTGSSDLLCTFGSGGIVTDAADQTYGRYGYDEAGAYAGSVPNFRATEVGPLAYDTDGLYGFNGGAGADAYEAFITVQQPSSSSVYYISDLQIYAFIDAAKPFSTTMWVRILITQYLLKEDGGGLLLENGNRLTF